MFEGRSRAQKVVWCLIGLVALAVVADLVVAFAVGNDLGTIPLRVFFACLGGMIVLLEVNCVITGLQGYRGGRGPIRRDEHPVFFWIVTGLGLAIGLALMVCVLVMR